MKKYQAIIFDLDGTLLNTLEDLMDSVNFALRQFQMPERSLEQIRRSVGNGVRRLMELSVPERLQNPEFEEVFQAFQTHYTKHCNDKTQLYPGIALLLQRLKAQGVKMAIVSNKYHEAVQELKEMYFKEYLSVAIGEKEGIRKKPAPDTVIEALRELEITKEQAVYVGDSDVDLKTAANSGMDCLSVTWGFRTKEELLAAGATVMINDPEEILKFVN